VVALPEITPTDGSSFGMRWEQKGLVATTGQRGAAYSLGTSLQCVTVYLLAVLFQRIQMHCPTMTFVYLA
jgi:hypothetical protein